MFLKKNNNKKWQRRPQLYKGRFFYVKQVTQMLLVVAFMGCLVALFIYFKNSKTLFIQNIDVLGDHPHISKQNVIKLAKIKPTDKLFSVNLTTIANNIKKFPWIDDVAIRREFPDTLQIHVTEKKPLCLLLVDQIYLVDKNGNILKAKSANEYVDLPLITGFDKEFIEKYPRLSKEYLKSSLQILQALSHEDIYKKDLISEVHFDPVFGFTVFTEKSGLEIYYGKDNIVVKQLKLNKFVTSAEYKKKKFIRLDLDPKNKIIARLAK